MKKIFLPVLLLFAAFTALADFISSEGAVENAAPIVESVAEVPRDVVSGDGIIIDEEAKVTENAEVGGLEGVNNWLKKIHAQLQQGYWDYMNGTEDSTGEAEESPPPVEIVQSSE